MKTLFQLSSLLITFLYLCTSVFAQEPVHIAQLESGEESNQKETHSLESQITQEAAKTFTRTVIGAKPNLIVKEIKLDTMQLTSPHSYYFLIALDRLRKTYQGEFFNVKQFKQSLKNENDAIAQEYEKGTRGFITDELIFEGIDEDGAVGLAAVGKEIESIQDCWTMFQLCRMINPNTIREAGIKPGDRYPNFYRAKDIVRRLDDSGRYMSVGLSSFPGQSPGKIILALILIEFSPSQLALIEAGKLERKNTADAFRKAIRKYQEALLLAKKAKEQKADLRGWKSVPYERGIFIDKNFLTRINNEIQSREGDILAGIAQSYESLGEFYHALYYYQKALSDYEIKNRQDAEIYQNTVEICQSVYKRDCSQEPQVLTLVSRKEESSVLESIANIYNTLGDQQTARRYYQQALSISLEKRKQQQNRGT